MKKFISVLALISLFFISIFAGFYLFNYFYYPVPKIIHYVWVGEEQMPDRAKKALESWKKYAPGYEIKRHDETNCDVNANPYVQEAYRLRQYRYVSDWCRFMALYNEGGIYLDVDHFLHGSINDLRKTKLSFSFEDKHKLATTGIAAAKHHKLIKNIIEFYKQKEHFSPTVAPIMLTPLVFDFYPSLEANGTYQRVGNQITLWPTNYYMIDLGGSENKATHRYYNSNFSKEFGVYYEVFKNAFLNGRAYHLESSTRTDYLIPTVGDVYYKLSSKDYYKLRFLNDKCFEIKSISYDYDETYCLAERNIFKLQKEYRRD